MNNKTLFNIKYPLNILDDAKIIDFENKDSRSEIFKRNLFYFNYGDKKNNFLEERGDIYLHLSHKLHKYINTKHPDLEILNISIFGSSLYSKNPWDFDFLTIVKDNAFLFDETSMKLNNKDIKVGISIKGLDNFVKGFQASGLPDKMGSLEQISDRTAISLFRRHIPLFGYDFVNNDEVLLKNINAQASDLLHNAYAMFYLDNKERRFSDEARSRKILSRMYAASSYLAFGKDIYSYADNLRKSIYLSLDKNISLSKSKKIFDATRSFYGKEINKENCKNE